METAQLSLRESIERMRAIPAKWKHLAHPIQEMQRIRRDPFYDPWASPEWAVPFVPCCECCNCDVPTRTEIQAIDSTSIADTRKNEQ
jgi:hypothetical protein